MAATTASAHELPSILHQRTLSNLSAAEDLFSSITGLDDLAADDDLSFDDIEDSLDGGDRKSGSTAAKKGKNRPASTAEKKATHNAVERARRESLNARFLVLADMLPGMTQVKRASKAAIVNKSIDLILELQKNESKLAKENDTLKAQLEALRNRVGSPSTASSASAVAANAVAAVVAAQEAAARQASMHQHALFPGMQHPTQLPMSMMPHVPTAAAMASMAAAAAAGNPMMQQQAQQQQQAAPQMQQNMAAHAPPTAEMGSHLFPGIFSGVFPPNANGTFDAFDNARSESGSPSSAVSHHSAGSASAAFAHGLFDLPHMTAYSGLTEGSSSSHKSGLSPTSGYHHSPPGTVASLAGSERTNQSNSAASQLSHNGAPSPASSNGVPTPPSHSAAYSPLGLSAFAASTPQSQGSNSNQSQQNSGNNAVSAGTAIVDPVIASLDGPPDAAYLAAHFAPTDMVKAQNDLQAFMLHQHRMALASARGHQQQPHTPVLEQGPRHTSVGAAGTAQMSAASFFPPPTPGALDASNAAAFGYGQQQQQQHSQMQNQLSLNQQISPYGTNNATGIDGMCGPSAQVGMNGMPAWQMMMAQHQAIVAAYGQQPHY